MASVKLDIDQISQFRKNIGYLEHLLACLEDEREQLLRQGASNQDSAIQYLNMEMEDCRARRKHKIEMLGYEPCCWY